MAVSAASASTIAASDAACSREGADFSLTVALSSSGDAARPNIEFEPACDDDFGWVLTQGLSRMDGEVVFTRNSDRQTDRQLALMISQ